AGEGEWGQWGSAFRWGASIVVPHQMRKPAGASRYDPMSNATFSFSRKAASAFANAAWPSAERAAIAGSTTFKQTLVFERVCGTRARKSTHGVRSTQSAIALALASARAMRALRPANDFAHCSASI